MLASKATRFSIVRRSLCGRLVARFTSRARAMRSGGKNAKRLSRSMAAGLAIRDVSECDVPYLRNGCFRGGGICPQSKRFNWVCFEELEIPVEAAAVFFDVRSGLR